MSMDDFMNREDSAAQQAEEPDPLQGEVIHDLRSRLQEAEEELRQKSSKIIELESKQQAMNKLLVEYKVKEEAAAIILKDVKAEAQVQKEKLQCIQELQRETEAKLHAQIAELEHKLEELQAAVKHANDSEQQLKAQLSDANAKVEEIQAQLGDVEGSKQQLAERLHNTDQQRVDAEVALSQISTLLRQKEDHLDSCLETLTNKSQELDEAKAKICALKTQLTAEHEEATEVLAITLKRAQIDVKKANKKVHELEARVSAAESKAEAATKENSDQIVEIAELKSKIRCLEREDKQTAKPRIVAKSRADFIQEPDVPKSFSWLPWGEPSTSAAAAGTIGTRPKAKAPNTIFAIPPPKRKSEMMTTSPVESDLNKRPKSKSKEPFESTDTASSSTSSSVQKAGCVL